MAEFFSLTPGGMDHGPLSTFLEQHGVDAGRRDQMIGDVMNAFCRYGHAQEPELLKGHLENFVAAVGKLEAAMPKLGSKEYARFSDAILSALPTAGTATASNARVREFSLLPTTLRMICAAAAGALKKLKKDGRPQTSKKKFVNELKIAWVRGTGKKPGISGRTTFKKPITMFEQFVRIAIDMLPDSTEFETGFANLVRGSRRVAKPTQKI